jgi:hypothetical protein
VGLKVLTCLAALTHVSMCLSDPTISFRGLGTWKRNIASLKLFLRRPKIELKDAVLDR